jgi:selenocysteine-specific elongation factor
MHVVATAGHVDHGKSALVRALTGREPDRLAEERRRGLTIDLGFVWTDLVDGSRRATVAFVDVPGHDRFLTNMLTGVGAVDDVLFVVAADDGWSAQSQEHLEIITLLDRRVVAAVVSKAGPAGPERSAEVAADVTDRLAAAGHADTPVVAVDALDGTGLDTLRATLLERLLDAALDPPAAAAVDSPVAEGSPRPVARDGFARLWVDRVFTVAGAGTVVTGTLTSGTLTRRQHLAVLPGGARGRVRELRALDEPHERVSAPARVAVALAGVDHDAVARGDVLVEVRSDDTPSALATCHLDVWVTTLPDTAVAATGAWQLHLGTAHRDVTVLPLLGDVGPGQQGPVRLRSRTPIAARVGDRFVVREVGRRRTVAGGEVLDVDPGPPPRGVDRRLAYATALDAIRIAPDAAARVDALLDAHGGTDGIGRIEAALGRTLDVSSGLGGAAGVADATDVADDRRADGGVTRLDGQLLRADVRDRWLDAMITAAATTDDPVCTRDALRHAARSIGCPDDLIDALLRLAIDDGQLTDVGGRVVHASRVAAYRTARERRREQLLAHLRDAPFAPVPVARLPSEHGIPFFEVQPLVDDGLLFVRDGLLFVTTVLDEAMARLDARPALDDPGSGPVSRADGDARTTTRFTASEARQCWQVSRKVALPLLEQLRATGRTTFDGTHHHRPVGG